MAMKPRRQLKLPPPDERSAQEQWFDANIRHEIGRQRVIGGIRTQVWKLLDKTEVDLRQTIERRLRRHSGADTPANVRRMRRLLADIETLRGTAWGQAEALWISEMSALAAAEPMFLNSLLQTVVPVQLETTLPTRRQLDSLIRSKPFEGRTMGEWARSIRRTDIQRIHDQVRIGLTQGEVPKEIARRVVGTARLNGRNGVTEITRRNAETITRTAANHFSNQARQAWYAENTDIFDMELFVATLDSKTTPICRSLDGKKFKVGEGPVPELHWGCRSTRVALMDAEAIGRRPAKPVTRRQMLREFAKREGLDRVPLDRKKLPRGTKGAFDRYERQRVRELTGTVPAKTTYSDWIRRQSAQFQDDVLGPRRGALFRRGGLTLDQFVDQAGKQIPLRDLARFHREAFEAAGLKPAAFLKGAR